MAGRRQRISRIFHRIAPTADRLPQSIRPHGPRKVGRMVVDFSRLGMPMDVRDALAESFWNQVSVRSDGTLRSYWNGLRTFARFVIETRTVSSLSDVGSSALMRYVEWLNRQRRSDGEPWAKGTRYSAYMSLRALLQWLQRCRPGALGPITFPGNPFPWKNRDTIRRKTISAEELRAILKACEQDIAAFRALREDAERQMEAARCEHGNSINTLGELLQVIEHHHGGLLPPLTALRRAAFRSVRQELKKYGGIKRVSLCLYPRAESLLPYYLAILIHTAGNPQAIAELTCDCLQPIPLLDDRELLVWRKGRARTPQRRAFRRTDSFEPPTLIREIIQWTRRLRPYAKLEDRNRLFLFRTKIRVGAFTPTTVRALLPTSFLARHHLPPFTLASIRRGVLTAFYRASGDLRQVKTIANHAQLSTTVGYLENPEVQAQNRLRLATLQSAFIGRLEHPSPPNASAVSNTSNSTPAAALPRDGVVSMFGFNCKDPFAGIAPGTRRGELCTNILGCFTCPNAVITADAASVARLLQCRDHLRAARAYLHPARWEVIYAPQLRILEEDILTRLSGRELAAAAPLQRTLPPLPELR